MTAINTAVENTVMTVGYKLAHDLIIEIMKAKLVPMLWGSPAIGKSQLIFAIAKQFGLKVIDIRLSQSDPVDLNGFPVFVDGKGRYVPMETFPVEGDQLPTYIDEHGKKQSYNGWVIFMDELTSACRATQAAAYKPILDRMVGTTPLHEKALVVAAGNQVTDNAVAEEMSTALQSRMVHLVLEPNLPEWLDWAYANNIDHRITAYLKSFPDRLYSFSPTHTDKTYEAPRTWEFTNRFIKGKDISNSKFYLPLVSGTIGIGGARQFLGYCQIYPQLPTQYQLENQPLLVNIPEDPSVLYALMGIMGTYITVNNADALMEFINRLPLEFQTMAIKEFIGRSPGIQTNKSISKWVGANPRELF